MNDELLLAFSERLERSNMQFIVHPSSFIVCYRV
jgi:hypothetical protein